MLFNQEEEIIEALNGLRSRCAYFQKNIIDSVLFEPEFDASKKINSMLEAKELSNTDVIQIITLFNELNKVEHYNGTGWYDYQLQLGRFLRLKGYEIELVYEDEKQLIII